MNQISHFISSLPPFATRFPVKREKNVQQMRETKKKGNEDYC